MTVAFFRSFILSIFLLCCSTPWAGIAKAEPAAGAVSAAPSETKGTRLILLGTGGGPLVHLNRSQPANLLVVDGRTYLIDCGDGTVWQLRRAGFAPTSVSKIFLTHLHFDHVAGLAPLMGFNWVSGMRQEFDVYGPKGVQEFVKGALDYLNIPELLYSVFMGPHPKISEITHAHDIELKSDPMLVYQDDKIRVTAIENSHYSATPKARGLASGTKSYSYRFQTPDKIIVFTGDSGPSERLKAFARGADILVSEVIDIDAVKAFLKATIDADPDQMRTQIDHQTREHLSPEEVGKLAASAKVQMVILTHISPSDDVAFDSLRYTLGVRKFFNGVVVAGRDLDQF